MSEGEGRYVAEDQVSDADLRAIEDAVSKIARHVDRVNWKVEILAIPTQDGTPTVVGIPKEIAQRLVNEVRRLRTTRSRLSYHHKLDGRRAPEDPAGEQNPKYAGALPEKYDVCPHCREHDELAESR